jgi:serine/threonine-protein kinase
VSSANEKARSPVAPGELVVGKYRVDRVIGAGGMGIVVAATHVELEQKVALKFLHAHILDGDSGVERFSREARAAVRLKSEHVARVYDVGVLPDGAPFSVMELLDGVDVANYAAAKRPLTVEEAVEIVLQTCDAIVEAHAAGIVHRDLKPQNLFVTHKANGAPLIKVLDFGVSKWTMAGEDMSLTDSSVVVGSPLYMAPEQMRAARNAEPRSDIWALGVILYELLAGKVPFDGATVTELCLKVVTDPPVPLLELRSEIPAPLAAIVARCLEKEPAKRFENVALLAQALEPFAASVRPSRAWRSMVETGDSLDIGELPTMPEPVDTAPESSSPSLATSRKRVILDHPPPSSRGPRRLAFTRGVAAGAVLTAIGAIAGVIIWASTAQSTDTAPIMIPSAPIAISSAPASTAMPDPPATTIASTTPAPQASTSANPIATSHGVSSNGHIHLTDPAGSSKKQAPIASASASTFTPPNGAPILH